VSLTGVHLLLVVLLLGLQFGLGALIKRWLAALAPLAVLVAFDRLLADPGRYNRVPEEWQATIYGSLVIGVGAVAAGVAFARRRSKPTTSANLRLRQ